MRSGAALTVPYSLATSPVLTGLLGLTTSMSSPGVPVPTRPPMMALAMFPLPIKAYFISRRPLFQGLAWPEPMTRYL